jgi:hypothetical protein
LSRYTEWCDTNLLKLIEDARERGMRSLPETAVACAMKHILAGLYTWNPLHP